MFAPTSRSTARLPTRLLGATWAALLLARLLLLGHGALADYDERRYFQSLAAVRALAHGEWRFAAYSLSMTAARPVDALWRCLPAAGQLALHRWLGWDIYDYPSLLLPTSLNWLTTVATAWLFYGICRRLLADAAGSQQWALVAAVLYASLANTSLYVRHVLPYDGALLLFMALLHWVLRRPVAPRSCWFWLQLGVGAGLLWLWYPGYYAGPLLLVAPLLDWRRPAGWVLRHLSQLLALGVGFAGPLLLAEGLSRLGRAPHFWVVSYDLSLHILQGAPSEGYTYLFKYLWQVERALGAVLLAGLFFVGWQLAGILRHQAGLAAAVPCTPRQRVLVAALLLFLTHATAAAVGHRIVWYGRLLHFYLPWLVLAVVAALAQVRQGAPLALGACLAGLVSYGLFFSAYQRILYPPDVLAGYFLNCLPPSVVRYTEDVRVAPSLRFTQRPMPARCFFYKGYRADSLTLLVNFAVLYPLTPATRSRAAQLPAATSRVLLDGPHYLAFPAYEFEGLGPAERAEAERQQFRLRVLRVAGAGRMAPVALPLPGTN